MSELRGGPVPLYQQLAQRLRRQITEGVYGQGERLPSEADLCVQFGVSRITVRAALDQLVDAGLLWRQRGKGTFVTAPLVEHELIRLTDFVEDMAGAGIRPASRITHIGEEPAASEVAQELDLSPHTPVVRLDRLRLADGRPIAFDVTYLPLRFGRLLNHQALDSETIYHQLEQQYQIPVVSGTFLIEAGRATGELGEALEIERGAPLLVIRRTSYTEGRDPIYYQQRYYRADRVRYRVELDRRFPGDRSHLTEFVPVFDPQN
ncbi:MAG TPA: GntR family transcriptional regulator [Thermomicrobiaceae bacterium]|nr:GntR family transcriptional regulator [Thermomicrobiaceae bacterium]